MGQFALEEVRGGEPQAAISLSLDDLYLANEPITMQARVIGVSDSALKAEIRSVSGDYALTANFVEQGKEWGLAIDPLPPGLYRVRVSTENHSEHAPTPVHDVFEVAGE